MTPSHAWALVTGASSGIGLEFARALAAEGRDVMLAARRIAELERIAADLAQQYGVRAVALRADLSEADGPLNLLAAAEAVGPIEVLINNAGLTLEGRYTEFEWEVHAAFLRTMLISPCELIRRTLPAMLERQSGTIINVASVSAFWPSTPAYAMYAASKSHLVKVTRALAEEYRGSGVSFTAVCPGITRTAIIEENTLAGHNARRLPTWLTAEPSTVAQRALAAARAGKTVTLPNPADHIVTTLFRLIPEEITNRALGAWLTRSYDRWRHDGINGVDDRQEHAES